MFKECLLKVVLLKEERERKINNGIKKSWFDPEEKKIYDRKGSGII